MSYLFRDVKTTYMSYLLLWIKKTQSWLIKSAVKNLPLAYIPKCQSKIKITKKTESPKQQIKQNSEILCTVLFVDLYP